MADKYNTHGIQGGRNNLMIIGIGIDLCNIDRMKKAVARAGFAERVFTAEEIGYAESSANPAKRYASAFAAREALSKAAGLGLAEIGRDCCSVSRSAGVPRLVIRGELISKLEKIGVKTTFLSLSHESNLAVAAVVLEG